MKNPLNQSFLHKSFTFLKAMHQKDTRGKALALVYGGSHHPFQNNLRLLEPSLIAEIYSCDGQDLVLKETFYQNYTTHSEPYLSSPKDFLDISFYPSINSTDEPHNALFTDQKYHLGTHVNYSIIIPTLNGGEKLRAVIAALQEIDLHSAQSCEIIVVDDGSTDTTREVIHREMKKKLQIPIRYIRLVENRGPSVARNVGLLCAQGSLLCFTDDDVLVPKNWLTNFIQAFLDNPEIAGAGGWYDTSSNHNESVHDRLLYWQALPNVLMTKKSRYLSDNLSGNTANMCYRKEALIQVGGFSPLYRYPGFDDWEIKVRMCRHGFRLLFHTHMVRHLRHHTFTSLMKTSLLRGWGRFIIFSLHGVHPSFYNVTFTGSWRAIFVYWKKMRTMKKAGTYNAPIVLFTILILCTQLTTWFGKYWVPFMLMRRNASHE